MWIGPSLGGNSPQKTKFLVWCPLGSRHNLLQARNLAIKYYVIAKWALPQDLEFFLKWNLYEVCHPQSWKAKPDIGGGLPFDWGLWPVGSCTTMILFGGNKHLTQFGHSNRNIWLQTRKVTCGYSHEKWPSSMVQLHGPWCRPAFIGYFIL
jgi:hypothetical protein